MKKRYAFLPQNWLRFGLAAAFAVGFTLNLQAQTAPVKQWDKSVGGSGWDYLSSLNQTTDGGFILGGGSGSPISGDKSQPAFQFSRDFWVVKTNANGVKVWDKTFGTVGTDDLSCIIQTSDGGYLLGGSSNHSIGGDKSSLSNGNYDYWIIKIDANCNKVWDRSFGGTGIDYLSSIYQTSDGGYILGGMSTSGLGSDKTQASLGSWDYWIVKIDASGFKLWDRSFGGSSWDRLHSIKQTSDGGYILGGHSNSPVSIHKTQASKGQFDCWVIKLDASGNKLWDQTLGGSWDEALYSLQQTADGGFILGGYSTSGLSGDKTQASKGGYDYWLIKLDSSGTKLWDKTIGGSEWDLLMSVQQTTDDGYILGGYSSSPISGDKTQGNFGTFNDFWVVKTDGSGTIQWEKTIGGTASDRLFSLIQTADGGYIFGGDSDSGNNGNKSAINKGGTDMWIIKLAPDVLGVKEPEFNSNLSIFPNPSQGKFNLQLNNLTSPNAELTISDLLGRVVLKQEFQTTNNQLSEEIQLPNAKGIYLLQLKAGEHIFTRKIVVE